MKNLYKNSIVLLFLTIANASFAQWQVHGPYGGPIYSSVSAAGKIFIGTGNGVFSSADNGNTWSACNTGIQRISIVTLVTDGTNLYAGGEADGVFFSSDNGASWQARDTGLTNLFINSIFVSSNGIYAGTAYGEFYSSNNGLNWVPRNTGISAGFSVYAHTETGDTVYAGTRAAGLYKTTDSGAHWSQAGVGLADTAFIYTLYNNAGNMYAATNTGIYKSNDRGTSWSLSNNGFPVNAWATAFAATPGHIFAGSPADGVFVSADNGISWNPINIGIPQVPHVNDTVNFYPSVGALITSGTSVIASTTDGNFISLNNGSSWTEVSQGINNIDVTAIATNGSTVFATSAQNGVYSSTDNGASWNRSNTGLTSPNLKAILVNNNSMYVSAGYRLVFRSNDGGATWIPASSGITSEVVELKADSAHVFALTNGAPSAVPGVFQSADSGATWTEIPTGFSEAMSTISVTDTALYVGTWDGSIYFSDNNGVSWSNIGATLPDVRINSIFVNGNVLFVATDGSGIYKSTDNGASWNPANTSLGNLYVNDIQQKDEIMYAATWGGGIFFSNDNGASWSAYNSGLDNLYVRKICTQATEALYAATDAGVYATPVIVLGIEGFELPDVNVYPNPAAEILHITVPGNQKVVITLYNLAGDVVYNYEGFPASIFDLNLYGKAKGIYFLDVQTETGVAKKKIIIQ